MKKTSFSRALFYFVAFTAGLSLIIGAGYYRKSIPIETGQLELKITSESENKVKAVTYDIQNEGIPKRLLQPGRIAISAGHGGGIVNDGKQPLWLEFKTEGFNDEVKIVSTDPTYDSKTQKFNEAIKPGKSKNVSLNFDIPRGKISDRFKIGEGSLLVLDSKSGKLLAKVPLKVVNSKFKTGV